MRRTREVTMWCVTLAVAGIATQELVPPAEIPMSHVTIPLRRIVAPQPVSEDSLQTLGSQVVDGDVFRIARHASNAAYDGRLGAAPPAPTMPQFVTPTSAKAALVLRAIIGGPPWQAVIDGFPGHGEGMIVGPGDKVDRFSVRAISKDTAIIQAPDTTYRLTLKSEW